MQVSQVAVTPDAALRPRHDCNVVAAAARLAGQGHLAADLLTAVFNDSRDDGWASHALAVVDHGALAGAGVAGGTWGRGGITSVVTRGAVRRT